MKHDLMLKAFARSDAIWAFEATTKFDKLRKELEPDGGDVRGNFKS
jgi:hypothetical protein